MAPASILLSIISECWKNNIQYTSEQVQYMHRMGTTLTKKNLFLGNCFTIDRTVNQTVTG